MTGVAGGATPDLRSVALDAYLARRLADGYKVETRTGAQAVIVRRHRLYVVLRLVGSGAAEHRLVVSVDEHGEVSTDAAEPVRW
jgi:hypothetical protein